MNASLGSGVVGLAELALGTVDRGDIDDTPPAALDHCVAKWLGHMEHRVQIGTHHRIPVDLCQFAEGGIAGDASVIDQNVDNGAFGLDIACQSLTIVKVGHIDGVGGEVVALTGLLLQPRLDMVIVGRVSDQDVMSRIV
ncbi:conserved hypothetical protein [Halomonas sp. A3H3]|nr:conserved hypothetical protein [Halomonas sp. A3H3]